MRTIALALLAVICTQNFCLFLQQTFAAPQSDQGIAILDVADSEGFLRAATSVPKLVSENAARVEALSSAQGSKLAPCPGKRVKRFAKIPLDPGQSRTLSFTLGRDDFSFIGADNKPTVEPGDFRVMVGKLAEGFTLQAK